MKKIMAIIGIVILVGMYLTTLVLALIGTPSVMPMFKASIAATIIVPVFLYIWMFMLKMLKDKKPLNNDDKMIVFDNKSKIELGEDEDTGIKEDELRKQK